MWCLSGTQSWDLMSLPTAWTWNFEHPQGWGRWLCGSGVALQSGNVLEQLGGITHWQQ